MRFLLKWWWPSYAFIFPLIFLPSKESTFASDFTFRFLLNIFAIIFSFFLELINRPNSHVSDVKFLPNWLKQNVSVQLVILYGFWVVFSGFFTQNPGLSISGSLDLETMMPVGFGSSVWELSFCLIFILIYVRSKEDIQLKKMVFAAVAIAGGIIAVLAFGETLIGRSVFTNATNADGQLPYVSFPGRGHLAGFLCLSFGALAYSMSHRLGFQWIGFLICLGVGVTQNRASILGISAILILLIIKKTELKVPFLITSITMITLGFFVSQENLWKNQTVLLRTQGDLSSGRLLLWKSAINGILSAPIFGWGGADYKNHWADFLSKSDLVEFFKAPEFGGNYKDHSGNLFVLKDSKGSLIFKTVKVWYAHNDFLDKGLSYGLIGLFIYICILLSAIKYGWKSGSILAVIGYQVFLFAWFPIEASQGTYWCLLALSSSEKYLGKQVSAKE